MCQTPTVCLKNFLYNRPKIAAELSFWITLFSNETGAGLDFPKDNGKCAKQHSVCFMPILSEISVPLIGH